MRQRGRKTVTQDSGHPRGLYFVLDTKFTKKKENGWKKVSQKDVQELVSASREKKVNKTLTTIMNVCLMCTSLLEYAIFSPFVRQQWLQKQNITLHPLTVL